MVYMTDKQHQRYESLGKHLRYLREQQAESVAEVSGAVEIDVNVLERIESGQERPAEEILMLLISHFKMQDQEAVQLWELAGYDNSGERTKQEEFLQEALQGQRPVIVLIGHDNRVMYTDAVQANADKAGVTLEFAKTGAKNQAQSIARLGMSKAQAREVVKQIELALLKSQYGDIPKQLPPTTE